MKGVWSDPLAAYARLWAAQQFEQVLLSAPGYVQKGQPLLAVMYLIHIILAIVPPLQVPLTASWRRT